MAEQRLKTCIVWFRRDLRCYDNPALVAALNSAERVVPLFIWAPEEEGQFQPGRQTRWWCKHSVMCLAQRLEQLGSRLVVRRARDSLTGLRDAVRDLQADGVFFNHLYDSISMVRDQQVKDELRAAGVAVSSYNADLLYEPWEVVDEQRAPFTTFKTYWDRCLAMPYAPPLPLPEPSGPLPAVPADTASRPVRAVDWFMSPEQEASTEALAHRWDPSGAAAVARLEAFLDQGLPVFEHDRAKTDRESTTMLSPWIHFGSLSVRHVYYRVAQKHAEWCAAGADRGRSCLDFLQQMGYREYSRYLAFHFPFITERSMLAHLRAVPWRLDQAAFKAWRRGLTGYPLVDAGMRQLWAMGWCHNRVRVVASHFMVKHLLLPWQWGLKHLWDCQIDADLECDALGWQYVSGCLSDAHPFSYLVDLEEEWKRFDPDGAYVRRWLPVLAQLPAQYVHQPWKAPPEVLEAAGVELGGNYPWPIITPDAAKKGVALASAVIERCGAASSSGGAVGGGGSSSGTAVALGDATASGGSGSASGGSGGGSGGSGLLQLSARKEPYRPPTDPALMSSFLAASWEGCGWQDQLPPLHITGATGHPLSLTHSAQARPLWGPALRPEQRAGAKRTALGVYAGAFEHNGRRYGLARGAMGQQQLLPAPAESGSGSVSFLSELEEEGGSGAVSGSGSGAPAKAKANKAKGAAAAAPAGDSSSAMDEDDDVSSSCVGAADGAGRAAVAKKLAAAAAAPPKGSGSGSDDDAQVVPSASDGAAAVGKRARVAPSPAAVVAAGLASQQPQHYRRGAFQQYAADDSSDDDDDGDDEDHEMAAYGGGDDGGPEYSLGTACSHLSRPAAAPAPAPPSPQQQKQAAAAAAEGAARLQQLQVAERGAAGDAL